MVEETFSQALETRILLFDGAMGTEIQKLEPKPEDFPDNKDGFNDGLSQTRPEWIKQFIGNILKQDQTALRLIHLVQIK